MLTEVFNELFNNAVKQLNIEPFEHFSADKYYLNEDDDPILRAP